MPHRSIYALSLVKKLNAVFFGLLSSVALNRALGVSLRGEYEYIFNIIVTLSIVLHLGFSTVFPNYFRAQRKWTSSTFIVVFISQFFLYLLLGGLAAVIFRSVDVFVWGLALCTSILATQLGSFCIVTDYRVSVMANTAGVVGNAVVLWMAYFLYPGSLRVVFGCFVVKELLISIICLRSVLKKFRFSDVLLGEVGGICRRGFVPMLTNLLVVLNYRLDILLLGAFAVPSIGIGLYAVGIALAEYVWLVPDLFKEVVINKTAIKDSSESVAFSCRASSTFVAVVFVFCCFFAGDILSILYGEPFRAGAVVTILIFGGAWSMVYTKILGVLWLAQGHYRYYFLTLLFAVILNVSLNVILIPLFGIRGSAVASTVSYTFTGVMFMIAFSNRYNVSIRNLVLISRADFRILGAFLRRDR